LSVYPYLGKYDDSQKKWVIVKTPQSLQAHNHTAINEDDRILFPHYREITAEDAELIKVKYINSLTPSPIYAEISHAYEKQNKTFLLSYLRPS